jgi:hypothetical protein
MFRAETRVLAAIGLLFIEQSSKKQQKNQSTIKNSNKSTPKNVG